MEKQKTIQSIIHRNPSTFFVLAGPCAIEGRDIAFEIADQLVEKCDRLGIPLVFKGSYRKANRSRLDSFTGIGDEKALEILAEVGQKYDIPTVTDIHESVEADMAAQYVDVLQIPAFLFRQTELLVAAAKTGKIVNIKNGSDRYSLRILSKYITDLLFSNVLNSSQFSNHSIKSKQEKPLLYISSDNSIKSVCVHVFLSNSFIFMDNIEISFDPRG